MPLFTGSDRPNHAKSSKNRFSAYATSTWRHDRKSADIPFVTNTKFAASQSRLRYAGYVSQVQTRNRMASLEFESPGIRFAKAIPTGRMLNVTTNKSVNFLQRAGMKILYLVPQFGDTDLIIEVGRIGRISREHAVNTGSTVFRQNDCGEYATSHRRNSPGGIASLRDIPLYRAVFDVGFSSVYYYRYVITKCKLCKIANPSARTWNIATCSARRPSSR